MLYRDPETGKEYGEIIDRHALDGADLSDVILRYDHKGHVLARTRNRSLQLSIDEHGLKIQADMSGSEEAMGFYNEVKRGLIDKMSFAFEIGDLSYDSATNTVRILAIRRLYDVSIVSIPAYEQTQVSARSRFEALAEPDRTAYRVAQVANVHAEMRTRIEAMGFTDEDSAENYLSLAEYRIACERATSRWDLKPRETEPIWHQILVIRDKMMQQHGSADFDGAIELRTQLDTLELQLRNAVQRRESLLSAISAGTVGRVIEKYDGFISVKEKKMNTETRNFFENVIETRAAGTTNTMTKIIPETVMDTFVQEQAPGAFFEAAKKTAISHSGNLRLPIATLQPVAEHPENEEIEDAGYVPGTLLISHKEYCYKTGYSDLGYKLSAQNLERIIRDTIMASMLKKMDGICLDAVAALEYTNGTNAVELAAAPAYADFVQLAGYLGSDFLNSAKWHMAPGTYFTWLAGLKDDQKRPILDTSKLVSDQAFCGYGIALDSQIPANTVYFGDATRVHLNYARELELNAWTDHDHNTQKFSIRTVAGAAAEPGCMVKMYLAG